MDIEAIDIVKGMKGKVHGKSNMFVRQNRITKKMHTGMVTQPNKMPASEKQEEHRKSMGVYMRAAGRWLRENHPTKENPEGTEAYKRMKREFESQSVIGRLNAYVTKKLMETSPSPSQGGVKGGGGRHWQ